MVNIKVANAPCSWGVVQEVSQLHAPGWRQVLDEIQQSGYAGTELGDWGFMPDDPALLRSELARRGLAMVGAFVPVRLSEADAHADGEAAALRTARLLAACVGGTPEDGRPFIILADDAGAGSHRAKHAGRIRPEHGLNAAHWRTFADGAQRIAFAVRKDTGLRTVFHHHCGTFVETPEETQKLLELAAADLIGLCLDTGHYTYGSGDPLEGLKRFAGRVWHVHFKDCDPGAMSRARSQGWDYPQAVRNGVFCGLGEGAVPLRPILQELNDMGYQGWIVVENEAPPGAVTPLQYAQRDRDYLRAQGL